MRRSRATGFTLVELVVTIALSGILAGVLATVIQRPLLAYEQLGRRAQLVDAAENALRQLERDVRRGLPNSLRITGGGRVLEVIPVVDAARYRRRPGIDPSGADHTSPSDWLSFTGDAQFNITGRFRDLSFAYGLTLPAETRVVVYSTTPNVYAEGATGATPGSITPPGTGITILDDGDEDQLLLSNPFDFLLESPDQRLYLVASPVTYRCDPGSGTLTRFSDYGFSAIQPQDPGAAPLGGGNAALVAEDLATCDFRYLPGTQSRAGLLVAELQIAQAGETISLLHQVHLENAP